MNPLCRILLIIIITIFPSILAAEGTKEVAPNGMITINGNTVNDIAALHINHPFYDLFGQWGSSDVNSRLHIAIMDPSSECIYIGLSLGHLNGNNTTPPLIDYMFRVLDPMGNVVYGPVTVTPGDANIADWSQAVAGPQPLAGSAGYIPFEISSAQLMSGGWTGKGDYYIEFENLTNPPPLEQPFLIDYWDMTVVNCSGSSPVERKGRVWSYNWAFFAINDFGFPNRPFNGAFYVCAPDADNPDASFVTKIDFNNSGFQPAAFNITFNSFGTMNSGDVSEDRKSVENANTTIPEYAIYLNDPVDICETATTGSLELNSIDRCGPADFCINLIPNKAGQVDILLDFDGPDGVYTSGTADLNLVINIDPGQVNQPVCLNWNGLDGLGNHIDETGGVIPIVLSYSQGIYHFPIYDAEIMATGFQIEAVRPAGPPPLLFYDDSNISTSSGSGEPPVNLSGCSLPCHSWINYTDPDFIGFGNLNTINSWWFSKQQVFIETVEVPNYLDCLIEGENEICSGDSVILTADFNTFPDSNASFSSIEYSWQGPGIVGETDQESIIVDQAGEFTLTIVYASSELRECTTACSFILMENDSCCAFDLTCPGELPGGDYECEAGIPEAYQTIEELIEQGLVVNGEPCGPLELQIEEEISGENGCVGESYVDRIYTVYEDLNENGMWDNNENHVACTQHFSVLDTIPPVFQFSEPLPGGIENGDTLTIQCIQNLDPDFIPDLSSIGVEAFDNCTDNIATSFFDTLLLESDCSIDGIIALFQCGWNAADLCGNQADFIFYLMIVDTVAPIFTDELEDATYSCDDAYAIEVPEAADECSCADVTFVEEISDLQCPGTYTILRTYTLEDHCGNSRKESQLIHFVDEQAPELSLLDSRLVEIGAGNRISVQCDLLGVPEWVEDLDETAVTSTDNCSEVNVSYSLTLTSSGDCESDGYIDLYKAEWIGTDECGNTSSIFIEIAVVDGKAPVFTNVPPSDCVELPDLNSVEIEDDCGVAFLTMIVDSSDSQCSEGMDYEIVWIATDHCGNQSSTSATYHIGDTKPPVLFPQHTDLLNVSNGDTVVLSCPPGGSASLSGFGPEDFLARDRCDLFTEVVFEEELLSSGPCGGIDPFYLIRVRWWSADECGNVAAIEIFVEIRDEEAPQWIGFEEEVILECGQTIPDPAVTDNCLLSVLNVEETEAEGECPVIRTIFRQVTAMDECGNSGYWEQIIRIHDRTCPSFDGTNPIVCDLSVVPSVLDVCDAGAVDLEMTEELSDGICDGGEIIKRLWKASDRCGNISYFEQTIIDGDLTPPAIEISYPGLEDVGDGDTIMLDCFFAILEEHHVSATDGCSQAVLTVDINHQPLFDCISDGFFDIIDYAIAAVDACGNEAELGFTLIYRDQDPPIFESLPEDLTISCYVPDTPAVEVSDFCSNVISLDFHVEEGTNSNDQRTITNVWTAQDACGNESSAMQTITITDPMDCSIVVEEPVLCFSDSIVVSAIVDGGRGPYVFNWSVEGADCRIMSGNGTETILLQMGFLDAFIQVEITDADGCEAQCSYLLDCTLKKDGEQQSMQASGFAEGVYPNPFGNQLHIGFSRELDVGETIRIYNELGVQIAEIGSSVSKNKTGYFILDTEIWAEGIYFITIPSKGGNLSVDRVVKMKHR